MRPWEEVKLGSVLEKIIGGGTPSMQNPNYWDGDIFWCSVKDMSEDNFRLSKTEDTITLNGLKNSSSNLIPRNTVITSTRMGIGRAFINEVDMAINQDLKALVPNSKITNDYLLHIIILYREYLNILGNGATVKGIKLETLKNIKIILPSISTQKKIVKILGNYNDLIHYNLKQIKILETSSLYTFEEWFLKFKIEGKKLDIDQKTKLPHEWKNVNLTKYIELEKGIEPGSHNYEEVRTEDNLPFIRVGDLNKRNSSLYVSKDIVKNKVINENDVVISLDGSPGIVRFGLNGCYSTGIRKAFSKKKNLSNIFIFNVLKSQYIQKLIKSYASGTTILHAGSSVKKMKFILPTDEILEKYNKTQKIKFDLILNLIEQNKILKQIREILMPRLMTNKIDIEKINI